MYTLFVSHIHEEAALAKILKDWFEDRSAGQWNVFVSSDRRSNAPGTKWFSRVNDELEKNTVLIALCSPSALKSLWLGYEAGYAAAKGVPIIPICHSGTTFDELPYFFSAHTGLDITNEDFENNLFDALHEVAPLLKKPGVYKGEIRKVIDSALAQLASVAEPMPIELSVQDETNLESEECMRIVQILANTDKGHSTRYVLAQQMGMTQMFVHHYAEMLRDRGLLSITGNSYDGSGYDLTPLGIGYALKSGLIVNIATAYQDMTADEDREAQALEWSEATLKDVDDATR